MASAEFPLILVRGATAKAGWAQLIRLGGDRVAILFDELRKSIGRIEGVFQRLHYSAREERWVVQYRVEDAELFTVRISPGVLDARMVLSRSEVERLLQNRNLNESVKDVIHHGASGAGSSSVRFQLGDRRAVRSFVNLAKARNNLISNTQRASARIALSRSKTIEDR